MFSIFKSLFASSAADDDKTVAQFADDTNYDSDATDSQHGDATDDDFSDSEFSTPVKNDCVLECPATPTKPVRVKIEFEVPDSQPSSPCASDYEFDPDFATCDYCPSTKTVPCDACSEKCCPTHFKCEECDHFPETLASHYCTGCCKKLYVKCPACDESFIRPGERYCFNKCILTEAQRNLVNEARDKFEVNFAKCKDCGALICSECVRCGVCKTYYCGEYMSVHDVSHNEPTSPSYSPDSPTYNPNSPYYKPTSPIYDANTPPSSPPVSYAPTSPSYKLVSVLEKKVGGGISKPRRSERKRNQVNYKRLHSLGF